MIWKIRDRTIELRKPLIMGVLNLTPDSFSDGGQWLPHSKAIHHAVSMVESGAAILDLGGESTRPGAPAVSVEEELGRVLPIVEELNRELNVPLSVDTTKLEVARACLDAGAHIVNDVSGLKDSGPEMAALVRDYQAGLILMHRRGSPQTMQTQTHYDQVSDDVLEELRESLSYAFDAGVDRDQIVIDPGLGFAKTAEQNVQIIRELEKFHTLDLPIMLGPSRKSFIGHVTGRDVHKREFGTAAVVAIAIMKGVHVIRVHEVEAINDVISMVDAIRGETYVRTF